MNLEASVEILIKAARLEDDKKLMAERDLIDAAIALADAKEKADKAWDLVYAKQERLAELAHKEEAQFYADLEEAMEGK